MIIYRNGVEVATVKPLDSSTGKFAVMAENSIFLEFYTPSAIDIRRGDYCTAFGKKYFINKVPIPEQAKGVYKYTLTLLSTREETMKAILMQYDDPEVVYTCTPLELLTLVVESMQRLQPTAGWTVGDCIIGEILTLSFSAQTCYEALNTACSSQNWNTEWYAEGHTLHMKKQEVTPETVITYSIGSGLRTITPENNDTDYYTRLYAFGSTKNMVDGKRLAMDVAYLQVDNPSTIIEHIERFEHIYPRLTNATITQIPTGTINQFADLNLEFNPKDQQIDGLAIHVVFLSGDLIGLDFEANFNFDTFELIPYTDEGGVTWPNDAAKPQVGDRYVLYNIDMPSTYKTAAMAELKATAQALLDSRSVEPISLNVTTDDGHFLETGEELLLGNIVNVQDAEIPPLVNGRQIRITEFKRRLNTPYKYESVKLSDVVYSNPLSAATAAIEQTQAALVRAGITNPRYSDRHWRDSQELINMLNGVVSNFTESVSPISVQTMAMLIGDESLQYRFVNSKVSPVVIDHTFAYNPLTKIFSTASGIIQHMTLGISTISSAVQTTKFWDVSAFNSETLTEVGQSYYLYLVCSKTGTTGYFLLSQTRRDMVGSTDYYFLVGILNSEYDSDRGFSPLYGFVELTPGRIRADKFISTDGTTYVDLINKIIQGKFTFLAGSTGLENIEGVSAIEEAIVEASEIANAAQSYAEQVNSSLQAQIDGQIISWFRQVDALTTNSPASEWTTEALKNQHANDTYTNTSNGKCWRWQYASGAWSWGVISDTATQQALTAAARAQDTADGKRRVFTIQPAREQAYDVGDLWVNATYGTTYTDDLLKCKTAKIIGNAFDIAHWEKASRYTDDTAADAAQEDATAAAQAAAALNYLKEALGGDTTIAGGLALLNLLLLKDSEGVVNGGFSGIGDDPLGVFTGGTYAEAIEGIAKNILYKNGNLRLANGNFVFDVETLSLIISALIRTAVSGARIEISNIDNSFIIYDSDNKLNVKISPSAVKTFEEIETQGYQETDVSSAQVATVNSVDGENVVVLNEKFTCPDGFKYRIKTPRFRANLQARLGIGGSSQYAYARVYLVNETTQGATLLGSGQVSAISETTLTEQLFSFPAMTFDNFPAGVYSLRMEVETLGDGAPEAFGYARLDPFFDYSFIILQQQPWSEIGIDGFNFNKDFNHLHHYSTADGFVHRGAMNIPGVLAAMSYASGGAQDANKRWGAKASVYDAAYTSVGQYRIPHAIGHSNYTAHITCGSAGAVGTIVSRANTYVDIVIQRNGSNYQSAFDIMLIGNNN